MENGAVSYPTGFEVLTQSLGDVKHCLDDNPDGNRYILMMGIALGLEFLHSNEPICYSAKKEMLIK